MVGGRNLLHLSLANIYRVIQVTAVHCRRLFAVGGKNEGRVVFAVHAVPHRQPVRDKVQQSLKLRSVQVPGNEHEKGVVAIAALPVDAGQGLRGDGLGLAPEEKVAEAGQEKEEETEDDLGAGEEDQEDEEEPAPEEDLLVDNVDGEDAHA
jgi:hypothetical protein